MYKILDMSFDELLSSGIKVSSLSPMQRMAVFENYDAYDIGGLTDETCIIAQWDFSGAIKTPIMIIERFVGSSPEEVAEAKLNILPEELVYCKERGYSVICEETETSINVITILDSILAGMQHGQESS